MDQKKMPFQTKISTPLADNDQPVSIEDFCRYLIQPNAYFFIPCRELWPGSSVNTRLPRIPVLTANGQPKLDKNGKLISIPATKWIDDNRRVEQTTWHPGLPMFITDRLAVAGGWVEKRGTVSFNLYRPPNIALGDGGKAKPWLDHVRRVYPDDADHIVRWLAHHRQHPGDKVNHALVLGGDQGIGKDSLLQPVKHAVGPWNFQDISPTHLLGAFNGFVRSVILRVSEGRDLGEIDRFKFYDHTKIYTATPPDVLRVNEKNLKEYYALNCLGLIITTNHKTDGIYLPANDRRHYVAWSNCQKEDFTPNYWNELWAFYSDGGFAHVGAYLSELDLAGFDAKAPPPKTQAFWQIVDVNAAPEDAELMDLLDKLGCPTALTIVNLVEKAGGDMAEWLLDRRNRRALPHRLERCGYVSIRNRDAKDGLWKFNDRRQVIYVRAELLREQQLEAALMLVQPSRG
jgi:hypothetical protein